MDTPDNYFDLVTARHTVIEPKQIYKTLKNYILKLKLKKPAIKAGYKIGLQ